MPNLSPGGGGDDGGGGGDAGDTRNALLDAIKRGASLKKVNASGDGDGGDGGDGSGAKAKGRRATIAAPSSDGGDLMSALKARMDQRRRGISGARKAEEEDGGTADARPSLSKAMTMPDMSAAKRGADDAAPISMAGIASALKAAASNRADDDDDDDEHWSD